MSDGGRERWRQALEEAGPGALGRRDFVKLAGAAAALAGLVGCTRAPRGKIVPYVVQPPEVTPGRASRYATSMVLDGWATGLVVESHEGRPTKIEGNPAHPSSLGASGAIEQAAILALYDPDRAKTITSGGMPRTWDALVAALRARVPDNGQGLHVVMPPTTSPLVIDQLRALRAALPAAKVWFHAPFARGAVWEGARIATGRVADVRLDASKADAVLALDADFLARGPGHLRHARDFSAGRRPRGKDDPMNRLYAIEPTPTPTGVLADHRLAVRASDVPRAAAALLGAIARATGRPDPGIAPADRWLDAAARDLASRRGRALVVAGEAQPPIVHAMALAANAMLGALGTTVDLVEPSVLEAGEPSHDLAALARALDAGEVETLLVLDTNLAYDAPADLDMPQKLRRARELFALAAYEDDTARLATWTIPAAHFLEAWGDARAHDGTVSFVQPLIEPLYDATTIPELLAALLGDARRDGRALLRESWRARRGWDDDAWNDALARGFVAGTEAAKFDDAVKVDEVLAAARAVSAPAKDALEVALRADAPVHDGRFANVAWLQELPQPLTQLTWDHAARLSAATAARLGVESGELLRVAIDGRSIEVPALVVPGQADGAIAIALGYGKGGAETVARGVGASAYALRSSREPWTRLGASVEKTGARRELAFSQSYGSQENRDVARSATLAAWRSDPSSVVPPHEEPETLYELRPSAPVQWGMAIDLSACTGCGACVVACQAENNVPVVGKDGVLAGRAMHWLRVDRYFEGDRAEMQPMMCQHCEKAPCEYVCPVGATVHSPDGLNEMVYNRCVGTRFCSNNCPYKVRRFNWFNYNAGKPKSLRLAMNPDVTVRARGVMEKCTYCVQRIREAEIQARIDDRPLRDGDVTTACQQACASSAIVFGPISDGASAVARMHASDRAYAALGELGTSPRTRYLARLRNPNPEIEG